MDGPSLEKSLLDVLSPEQLESEIKNRVSDFQGLLTREAAMRLIAKEKGIIKEKKQKTKISEITKGSGRIYLDAQVANVGKTTVYPSGTKARRIKIRDPSGNSVLVLWNDDCDIGGRLRTGDRVRLSNAYEKGGEIHLGYYGSFEITERAPMVKLHKLKEKQKANVRGFVKSVGGKDRFVKGNSVLPGFSFFISDGESDVHCVIWENLSRGDRIEEGDEVIIENALVSEGELSVYNDSRLLLRKKNRKSGKLEDMECRDGKLVLKINGEERILEREKALSFLGVSVSEDVELRTVVNLKKDSMVNNIVSLK